MRRILSKHPLYRFRFSETGLLIIGCQKFVVYTEGTLTLEAFPSLAHIKQVVIKKFWIILLVISSFRNDLLGPFLSILPRMIRLYLNRCNLQVLYYVTTMDTLCFSSVHPFTNLYFDLPTIITIHCK